MYPHHAGLACHTQTLTPCRGRGVTAVVGNKWRSARKLRGTTHCKTFNTRTEAALFFDLIGDDGKNFPGDYNDAEQMAETLRDVRSLPAAVILQSHNAHGQNHGHSASLSDFTCSR